MPELADPDEDYYDHLPDGTILSKMPFDDGDAMLTLLRERMTPEDFAVCMAECVRHFAQKHPEQLLRMLTER